MTKTQKKIVDKMNTKPYHKWYPLAFVSTIYSKETIDKYSYAGKSMRVIDHMTCLYLGRMVTKGILRHSGKSHYWLGLDYIIYKPKLQ